METEVKNYLSLKFGTLKSWNFTHSEKGKQLLTEYYEIGASACTMGQRNTPRQREIICELIDLCDEDTIYLDWEEEYVPKHQAKDYVMSWGLTMEAEQNAKNEKAINDSVIAPHWVDIINRLGKSTPPKRFICGIGFAEKIIQLMKKEKY